MTTKFSETKKGQKLFMDLQDSEVGITKLMNTCFDKGIEIGKAQANKESYMEGHQDGINEGYEEGKAEQKKELDKLYSSKQYEHIRKMIENARQEGIEKGKEEGKTDLLGNALEWFGSSYPEFNTSISQEDVIARLLFLAKEEGRKEAQKGMVRLEDVEKIIDNTYIEQSGVFGQRVLKDLIKKNLKALGDKK